MKDLLEMSDWELRGFGVVGLLFSGFGAWVGVKMVPQLYHLGMTQGWTSFRKLSYTMGVRGFTYGPVWWELVGYSLIGVVCILLIQFCLGCIFIPGYVQYKLEQHSEDPYPPINF